MTPPPPSSDHPAHRWLIPLLAAACAAGLVSCGYLRPSPPPEDPEDQPFGPTGIPPALRPALPQATATVSPGGNQGTQAAGLPSRIEILPEEDMVFTDPDNPDAPLAEFAELPAPIKQGTWEVSETKALQLAARDGKAVLLWFTATNSPLCRSVDQELFSDPAFAAWADEHLIRLKVESNPRISSDTIGGRLHRELEIRNYVQDLKKRYRIMGTPSFVLLNSSGEVLGRYRGYKRGDARHFWGQLKHGVGVSEKRHAAWRASLEQKGYRNWTDRKGRVIFAKLSRYSQGEVFFITPDGSRSKTHESNLSKADRDWIAEQKRLRSLP
jgi:thiol-disulfide isomerase/thioredoxin